VAIALALATIVGIAAFLLIPPSADRLYERIQNGSLQEPHSTGYARDLDEFSERFPEDPRADEVNLLRKNLRCEWLREELSNKFRELTAEEELYLRGMELTDNQQWDEATRCFQEIIDRYEGALPNASSDRLIDRSGHMLSRLQTKASDDPSPDASQ
jgi:hypothetical protein